MPKDKVHQPWCQKSHTRGHPQIELCWCQIPQSASLGAAYTQTRTGLSWNRRLPNHWSEVLPNCTGRAQMLLWKSLSEGSQVVTGSHHCARQMQDSEPCMSPKKSAVSDKVNLMCQGVTNCPSVLHCMRTLSSNDAHYSVWKEVSWCCNDYSISVDYLGQYRCISEIVPGSKDVYDPNSKLFSLDAFASGGIVSMICPSGLTPSSHVRWVKAGSKW